MYQPRYYNSLATAHLIVAEERLRSIRANDEREWLIWDVGGDDAVPGLLATVRQRMGEALIRAGTLLCGASERSATGNGTLGLTELTSITQ